MSSFRRTDLLNLAGLREDGRKPSEIRRMQIKLGPISSSGNGISGSALVRMGLTSVLATVQGPLECQRRSDELPDRAILEIMIRTTPYAPVSSDRRPPPNPQTDRRTLTQTHILHQTFSSSILLDLHPRSRIILHLLVLSDDGGRLPTCINACTLALVDAGIPCRDMICACGGGLIKDDDREVELVDLNRAEQGGNGVVVYVEGAMMVQRGSVVLAQCEARVEKEVYERVWKRVREGCEVVFEIMREAVREHASKVLAGKSGGGVLVESNFVNG